jgi:hypothetical protein
MHGKPIARYGAWTSPVTPELATAGTITFSELAVDGDDVYWLEQRPAEQGRRALVRSRAGGTPADVLPGHVDVGTRVHEYGGGAFAVRDGRIVYSERSDGSVWLFDDGGLRPLVAVAGCRYAGFALDAARERAFAVREDHRGRPPTAPDNAIVVLSLAAGTDPATNEGCVVTPPSDFVLAPQLSPDGTRLAWIAWNQPAMPFDETRLWVADLDAAGGLTNVRCVAGAGGGEAIVEAHWTPGGTLLFTSDRTNWWNVYALRGDCVNALAVRGRARRTRPRGPHRKRGPARPPVRRGRYGAAAARHRCGLDRAAGRCSGGRLPRAAARRAGVGGPSRGERARAGARRRQRRRSAHDDGTGR